jgi:NADH-quinone oxidoreductase subunit M
MGAWAAAVQKDLKRIFAYSSINHLGYCLLASLRRVAGASAQHQLSQTAALDGVILQMFNHGLTAAAIFWFLAMLEERSGGLRGINDFGGLRKPAPVFCRTHGHRAFHRSACPD